MQEYISTKNSWREKFSKNNLHSGMKIFVRKDSGLFSLWCFRGESLGMRWCSSCVSLCRMSEVECNSDSESSSWSPRIKTPKVESCNECCLARKARLQLKKILWRARPLIKNNDGYLHLPYSRWLSRGSMV